MALVLQDLWSQVLRCAAEGLGASLHARARDAALRKTKIGQTQVTRSVQPKLGKIQYSTERIRTNAQIVARVT